MRIVAPVLHEFLVVLVARAEAAEAVAQHKHLLVIRGIAVLWQTTVVKRFITRLPVDTCGLGSTGQQQRTASATGHSGTLRFRLLVATYMSADHWQGP